MKNQKGFSLIELLIVVVIIGIIAAIAIPNLLAARRSANEGAAVSTQRMLHSSQVTFAATQGSGNYAGGTAFAGGLSDLNTANLIDTVIAGGTKSGFDFATLAVDRAGQTPSSFVVGSKPTVASGVTQTGTRKFCVATEGIMRSSNVAANLATQIAAVTGCAAAGYPTVME